MEKIHTILLTDSQVKVLDYFLEELGNAQGNAGCNDLPNKLVNLFTPEEGEKIATEYAKYNNPDEPEGPSWPIPDFCLLSLLRKKIKDQCKPKAPVDATQPKVRVPTAAHYQIEK